MTDVEEIERAVDSLPKEEYERFRRWFLNREWERWDHEIDGDSEARKLDFLLREASEAKEHQTLRDLSTRRTTDGRPRRPRSRPPVT